MKTKHPALNLYGLTREEAARLLGVSVRSVKSKELGARGHTEAEQALLVSASSGKTVTGVSGSGQKVDVADTGVSREQLKGPFTVSGDEESVSARQMLDTVRTHLDTLPVGAKSRVDWHMTMDRTDAAYPLLWDKPEWDLMPDGWARGIPVDTNAMRADYRTPGAYFRILHKELGRKDWGRVTKEDFDNVDWKKLDLPRFEKVGAKVRSRLRSVRDLGTIAKVKE